MSAGTKKKPKPKAKAKGAPARRAKPRNGLKWVVPASVLKRAKRDGWAFRIRNAADRRACCEGCVFDEAVGRRVVEWAERFISEVAVAFAESGDAESFEEFTSEFQPDGKGGFRFLPWQEECTLEIFGWLRPNGLRRFRWAYIEIPKKNGKTFFAAILLLILLCADGEPNPEVYTAATSRNQAAICLRYAMKIVSASPKLQRSLRVIESTNRIVFDAAGGFLTSVSSEAGVSEGLNANGVVLDELHVHKKRKLYDTFKYAGASRQQPLFIVITTAGEGDRESIGWEAHEYASKILRGTVDNIRQFARIYSADCDGTTYFERQTKDGKKQPANYLSETVQKRANPGLGHCLSVEDFREDIEEALEKGDAAFGTLLRYRFNIWRKTTDRWLPMGAFEKCPMDASLDLFAELKTRKGVEFHAGADLGTTTDLTHFCVQAELEDAHVYSLNWFYLPEAMTRPDSSKNWEEYLDWSERGYITLTEGDSTDYTFLEDELLKVNTVVPIKTLVIDPTQGAYLTQRLKVAAGIPCIDFRSTFTNMSGPMKHLERLIRTQRFHTDGNPVLAWCLDNVVQKSNPYKDVRPDRDSRSQKIDGAIGNINALSRRVAEAEAPSIYEERGIRKLGREEKN